MRRKEQHEVTPVQCPVCGIRAPSTWGFVPNYDEPDNHLAPCGLPCAGGGISPGAIESHDDKECVACASMFE